jgi:hypothetical protein
MRFGQKLTILLFAVGAAVAVALAVPRIPQDPGYHEFADSREWLGVPNFLDVVSNAGFLTVGSFGVRLVWKQDRTVNAAERLCYFILSCAIIATALGSAYYHLAPDNARLFWDRLPLAIVAMAFTSAVISEHVSAKTGIVALVALTAIGAASVFYWRSSELMGHGDLRFYGLVQFLPMLLVPMMLFLFPSQFRGALNLAWAVVWYAVAKLCEHFDSQIFSVTGAISGHTLKHLFAALALYFVLRMVQTRR